MKRTMKLAEAVGGTVDGYLVLHEQNGTWLWKKGWKSPSRSFSSSIELKQIDYSFKLGRDGKRNNSEEKRNMKGK